MCLMCNLETSLQIFTILESLLAHIKPHLLVNEPMYEYCFPFNFQVSRWLGLRFSDSQVPACVLLLPSVAMIVISHLVDANTVVQDDNTLALKRWGLGQVSRWWLYYIISSNYEFKNWCDKQSKGAWAKFQGGCYLEGIPMEAGARCGALWSPAYADPSSYHSPAVLREDNLFGVLGSLFLNYIFF